MNKYLVSFFASILCAVRFAHAQISFEFYLNRGIDPTATDFTTPSWNLAPGIDLSDGSTLTTSLISPGGDFAEMPYPDGGEVFSSKDFASYADLQHAANDFGPWTLTINTPADPGNGVVASTSVYSLNVNLNIPANELTPTPPSVPTPGEIFVTTPTFSWPENPNNLGGAIDVLDSNGIDVAHTDIDSSITSWSPPALPLGNYRMDLSIEGPVWEEPIPVTPILMSGPAISIPSEADVDYQYNVVTAFTIAPEPSQLLATAALILITSRRCRPIHIVT